MRVSTQQLQLIGINAILDRQSQVSRTQNQLATGKRIITPADDPSGAANIDNFRQEIKLNEQYQGNIVIARQRLEVEESKLASVTNIMPRIRQLAIQANNDTLTNVDRRSIASEIRQRLDELLSIANTRDANGEYMFSGFQGNTKPFSQDVNGNFVYSGDQGQRLLQVNRSRQIADRDSGSAVFQEIRNGNGIFTTLDSAANTGAGIIDPGSVIDSSLYDGDTYTIAMANLTAATGAAPLSFVDTNTNDTLQYELRINGFLVNTYSAGDSRTLTELAADINTDVASTGVRAYVDTSGSGALYLANDPSSSSPITINETLTGATDGAADTLTGFFGSALTGVAATNTLAAIGSTADSFIVIDSSGNTETSGAYQDGAQISFNGIATDLTGIPNSGDSFTISPSANQDIFTILENLASTLEGGVSSASSTAAFHNAMNRVLADLDQAEDKILEVRGSVGSRLNVLDSQENSNEDFILDLRAALSKIEDLDFAEATGRFNLQMVGLEAAQQVYVRVQGLSLFNFI